MYTSIAHSILHAIVSSLLTLIPSESLYQDATEIQVISADERTIAIEVAPPDSTENFTPYSVAIQEGLKLPLPTGSYILTSSYGWRKHPITGENDFHKGLDFGAPYLTPLYAIADGQVLHVVNGSGEVGGDLLIRSTIDGRTVDFRYHHMENVSDYVKVGDTVKAGQLVTRVASTGISTGSHLHLEIEVNGERVDPEIWLREIGLDIYSAQRK